jgi:thiol-disulfide isomerase/thioredoxin
VNRRRRRLTGAVLALVALPCAAPAQQPRIEWTDIALLDGRVLKAADLAGRPVVVQMWASWCPFCARQNPHIEALHRAHGRELVVIGFSIDKTEQAARDYLKKHGYTFAAAMATPQVERWFGRRRALPEVYVVDRSGRVLLREEGEMFPEDVMALARFARPSN